MKTSAKPDKGTRSFILITAFLNLAGIGILNPILPAVVGHYVAPENVASNVGWLFSAYSLCQFLAVPTLGALSDRYGRRPVLLISLLGSAAGYLVFGLGGALWVLFAGRIIDGLTGGNIAAIYAYSADITRPSERTKFFGQVGSASAFGFIVGPAFGGVLSVISPTAPLYFAAAVTLLNTIWGYFVMPESLPADKRHLHISAARLNPFTQLFNVFRIFQLRWLLIGIFLWTFPFAMLQSNLSTLMESKPFEWTPATTSLIFLLIGIVNVVMQGFIVPRVLPRVGEVTLTIVGIAGQAIGFLLVAVVAGFSIGPLIFVALFFTASGNGLINPALNGLLSQAVSPSEQGRVQGGNQSIQALGRVLGPIYGGWAYDTFNHPLPYLTGAIQLGIAAASVLIAVPALKAHRVAMDIAQPSAHENIRPQLGED